MGTTATKVGSSRAGPGFRTARAGLSAAALSMLGVLLGLAGSAQGQPASPGVPMIGIDPANSNVSPYVGPTANPSILWQIWHDIPANIDSPGLVLDSRGILFSAGHVPVWAATGQTVTTLTMPFGRDGTPALGFENQIYHWESGTFHAYAASGTPLWTAGSNCSDGTTPKIGSDGTIYAMDCGGMLRVYSPNGTTKWTAQAYQGTNVPPAIDSSGNVYLSAGYGGGACFSYDPQGTLRWQTPWPQQWGGSPAMFGPDGNVYFAVNYGTTLCVVNSANGSIIRQQSNLYGGPKAIGSDGTLYSASYHTVQATDLYGTTKWSTTVSNDIYLEGLVVDVQGNVYCTDEGNRLLAFSNTGANLWTLQLPTSGWQSVGPIIGPDGTLYVQDGGSLFAITPEPATLALLALGGLAVVARRRRRMAKHRV